MRTGFGLEDGSLERTDLGLRSRQLETVLLFERVYHFLVQGRR
jgi:hypothetical protein